jgi:hypothetical protein
MKQVRSLCPESDRPYLKATGTPIQISCESEGDYYKVQLKKSEVRIESNRIVFEVTREQLNDLQKITKAID